MHRASNLFRSDAMRPNQVRGARFVLRSFGRRMGSAPNGSRRNFSRMATRAKGTSDGQILSNVPKLSPSQASFQTSAANNACLPTALPPKCGPNKCEIPKPNVFRDCKPKVVPKWEGCDKICMPCCCPAFVPPDCEQIEIRQNTCKRLEYRIPSFSECRKFPLGHKGKKECCYSTLPCPEAGFETLIEQLISVKRRQESILGRKRH